MVIQLRGLRPRTTSSAAAFFRKLVCECLLLSLVSIGTLQAKDKWIHLTSPHFQAISNAGDKRAKKFVGELEQFRQFLTQFFDLKGLDRLPVTVFVFKNDKSFDPYKPLYEGKPKNVAGFFQAGRDRNMIALNARSPGNPLHSVHHEYLHLIASYIPNSLPLWVNEGMAEFYSTFQTSSGKRPSEPP